MGALATQANGFFELGQFELGQSAFCSTWARENPVDFVAKTIQKKNMIVITMKVTVKLR